MGKASPGARPFCLIAIYYLLMCLFDEDATGEVVDGDDVEGCREA